METKPESDEITAEDLIEEFVIQFANEVAGILSRKSRITIYRDMPPNVQLSSFAQGILLGVMTAAIKNFMPHLPRAEAEDAIRKYIHDIVDPTLDNLRFLEGGGMLKTELVSKEGRG